MSRGRPPSIIPSERINLHLPADIKARLDLHLFSDVEGRIPKGAYSKFFEPLVREFFKQEEHGYSRRKERPVTAEEYNESVMPHLRLQGSDDFADLHYDPGDRRRYTTSGWGKVVRLKQTGLFTPTLKELES